MTYNDGMYDDIVDWLYSHRGTAAPDDDNCVKCAAAREIERLRDLVQRYRIANLRMSNQIMAVREVVAEDE